MALTLTSPSFSHGGEIPRKFTCEGDDISPEVRWSGAPPGTKSFALIVDDPDAPDPKAPKMVYVHWVVYNIPATASTLREGVTKKDLPAGAREGLNDWKRVGYGGPCPPIGRHRYFHKLYALDTLLPEMRSATKADIENAIRDHTLAQTELMGTYAKQK